MVDSVPDVRFVVHHRDRRARLATFHLPVRQFATPVFMPVGTRGMVRLFPADLLEALGYEVMLSNTYHLMLRPGDDVVASLGGLHRFNGWDRAILTDSGGFQVMSLGASVSEAGARFKSVYDGSTHLLTPEGATEVQERLGADIAMVLDVCTMLPADSATIDRHLALTHRWAARARKAKSDPNQAQFGIVQGGTDHQRRAESVEAITDIGFEGYAIGGLAVGEARSLTLETIDATTAALPEDRPRYLMGVGDPYTVAHAIGLGIDMFDCVAPSRLARHGLALTSSGQVSVKQARFRQEDAPLDGDCPCDTCRRYPVALLNHFFKVDPQTLGALLTRHNLTFMKRLVDDARAAIVAGTYPSFLQAIDQIWT
ncbi:MAG: tRNA guanosine(34) transglycosylase Tgt [Acidimicrobiales bacterium]